MKNIEEREVGKEGRQVDYSYAKKPFSVGDMLTEYMLAF